MKSLEDHDQSGVQAMAGVGMTSGVAAAPADARARWEDFSDFSSGSVGGVRPSARAPSRYDGLERDGPHPLTKDWYAHQEPESARGVREAPLESTRTRTLNVWTGTWNTWKPPPASLDISAWLDVASSPDLVVVGFQEIVPLTPARCSCRRTRRPRASGRPSSSGA